MGSGKTPTYFMTQLTAETAGLAVHSASLTLVPFFSFSLCLCTCERSYYSHELDGCLLHSRGQSNSNQTTFSLLSSLDFWRVKKKKKYPLIKTK